MKPELTSTRIFEEFNNISGNFLEGSVERWLDHHHRQLDVFNKVLRSFIDTIEAEEFSADENQGNILSATAEFLAEIEQWINHLDYFEMAGKPDDLLPGWSAHFDSLNEKLPEKTTILLNAAYFDELKEDSQRIKFWKRRRRFKNKLGHIRLRTINSLRKLFGKEELPGKIKYRQFSTPDFVRFYLLLPFSKLVYAQWEEYLQMVRQQFIRVYEYINRFCNDFLIPEKETSWQEKIPDRDSLISILKAFESSINELNTTSGSLKSRAEEAFERWKEEQSRKYRHNWNYAGTWALPGKDFDQRKIDQAQERKLKEIDRHQLAWTNHFMGEKHDWLHDVSITISQLFAGIYYFRFEKSFNEKSAQKMRPLFEESLVPLSEALQTFEGYKDSDSAELRSLINKHRWHLIREVRQKHLPEIVDTLIKADPDQDFNYFLDSVEKNIARIPDTHRIFRQRDNERIPPDSEFVDIPIKELIEYRALRLLRNDLTRLKTSTHEVYESVLQDLSEVDQIIEFNLEAAITLLGEKDDLESAHKAVMEGLSRAVEKMESFVVQIDELKIQSVNELSVITNKFIRELQNLIENEKVLDLKLQWAKAKTKESIRQYRKRVFDSLKGALPRLLAAIRLGRRSFREQYFRFRKLTGLEVDILDTQEKLSRFLAETNTKINSLPFVYQRLFRQAPLSDERFFAGREQDLAQLKQAFAYWEEEGYMTAVVIGEKGSGKTTLLNFAAERVFKGHTVKRVDLDKTLLSQGELMDKFKAVVTDIQSNTLQELEQEFNSRESRMVIVVENIQNLFLRTIDGFDLIEEFLMLISLTHKKIFWMTTCTVYSWEYLDKVIHITKYFQRVIRLDRLNRQITESIIMKRHRASGYKIFFEAPQRIMQSRKYRKMTSEPEQQEYLRSVFFQHLDDFGAGNITVTLLFWQRSILKVEKSRLVLNPVIEFDYSFLIKLPEEEIFTLGNVLHHDLLTAQNHAKIFHHEPSESIMVMNNLKNKGILLEKDGGFTIHPFMYRPVVEMLKRKNIIQ